VHFSPLSNDEIASQNQVKEKIGRNSLVCVKKMLELRLEGQKKRLRGRNAPESVSSRRRNFFPLFDNTL
jgi:hypothetical protein